MHTTRADGSAAADAPERVTIDASDASERWRYACPNGHRNWAPTNNHIWCQGCRRQIEAGDDLAAEHYELVDLKTDERVPWAAIEFIEG